MLEVVRGPPRDMNRCRRSLSLRTRNSRPGVCRTTSPCDMPLVFGSRDTSDREVGGRASAFARWYDMVQSLNFLGEGFHVLGCTYLCSCE
jgi:hypothetical protein